MKLISMTDFVLEHSHFTSKEIDYSKPSSKTFREVEAEWYGKILNYAQFLKQPLTLGMLVPCDETGNVMEEPISHRLFGQSEIPCRIEKDWLKAKERVLFEGFEVRESSEAAEFVKIVCDTTGMFHVAWFSKITNSWKFSKGLSNIESLNYYGVTLAPTAIKQIFG